MKNRSLIKKIILALFVLSAITPMSVSAVDTYTLLAPLPCIQTEDSTGVDSNGNPVPIPGQKCPEGKLGMKNTVTLKDYTVYAFNLMVAMAAVAAVFMIVWGGFEYMTSSIPGVKSDGLGKVRNAIIGLLMILCSYIILRTIDPRLVNIPSTLVPSLALDAKWTKDTTDFFSMLDVSAFQNTAEKQQAQAALNQARTLATAKQKEVTTLKEKFNALINDPNAPLDEINAAEVAMLKAINELNSIEADASLNLSKLEMYSQLSYLNSQKTYSTLDHLTGQMTEGHIDTSKIKGSLQTIDVTYKSTSSILTNLSDPNKQLSGLTQDYKYVHGQMLILGFANAERGTPDLYYANVQNTKKQILADISSLTDPEKKASLDALYKTIESKMNAVK